MCACLWVGCFSKPLFAQEPPGLQAALALERVFTETIAQAEPSVVSIARYKPFQPAAGLGRLDPLRPQGVRQLPAKNTTNPSNPDFLPNDFGAGILIASPTNANRRLVLTNYHVVRGGTIAGTADGQAEYRLHIRFANRRGCAARIVAGDPRSDLAVLEFDERELGVPMQQLKPMPLQAVEQFRKGQFVLALGNPYAIARDGSPSASWGIISNIARRPAPIGPLNDDETLKKETIHHFGTLLQVDTRLNLGTSGGPLLDLRGRLIGIATSLAALDGYEKSAGYAIPLDAATLRIIDSLARGLEVEYGFLGIAPRDLTANDIKRFSRPFNQPTAALAMSVFANSPASRGVGTNGGLRDGDVILSVKGPGMEKEQLVLGRSELIREVGLLGPGTTIRLRIWREAARRELTISVNLGKWPVADADGIVATTARVPAWRGLTVDYSTGRRKHLQYPFRYHRAVVVAQVASESRSEAAELRSGDFITHVDTTPVSTPAEFQQAIRGKKGDVSLRVAGRQSAVIVRK
jgi:serine protease Do